MNSARTYVGIDNDINGGMTPTGTLIRDAWVFGIIAETETCEGWDQGRIQWLYDKVSDAWAPYGHLVSRLPDELREKHAKIYAEAVKHGRENGWDPERDLSDDR